jgi:hypothetical protein
VQIEGGEREMMIWDGCVSEQAKKVVGNWLRLICPCGIISLAWGWPIVERTGAISPTARRNVPCQQPNGVKLLLNISVLVIVFMVFYRYVFIAKNSMNVN